LAPQKPTQLGAIAPEHSILCSLAKAHGTDKYPWYTPFYSALFADKHVKRVLEIGVLNGASLAMWRDYWPQAEVWGFDKERRETDIQVMYGDQSKPEDLAFATRLGPFDLVIDDGSHQPADQILGALTFVPHLAPGGLYIIEDVNPPFTSVCDAIPWPYQMVACCIPGNNNAGRCLVIPCPS
jgi:hypothetical protein